MAYRADLGGSVKYARSEPEGDNGNSGDTYTVNANRDYFLACDTTDGKLTLDLPAIGSVGENYYLKIFDEGDNAGTADREIVLDANGSDKIGNSGSAGTYDLTADGASILLYTRIKDEGSGDVQRWMILDLALGSGSAVTGPASVANSKALCAFNGTSPGSIIASVKWTIDGSGDLTATNSGGNSTVDGVDISVLNSAHTSTAASITNAEATYTTLGRLIEWNTIGGVAGSLSTSGKMTASVFVGALTGNASGSSSSCTGLSATATALATSRDFSATGQITTSSAVGFTGGAAVALPLILDKTAITAQTDLNANPANEDSLVMSDASDSGNLKELELGEIKSYMQAGLTFTTNTDVDVSVANLKTRLAGGFASNAVQIGDASDVVTIGNDLVVAGDLTVSGDTVQQDVTKLTVEDPLIELARSNGANALDIGFFGKYVDSGTKYAGLFRDASDGKFRLFKDTTVDLTGLTVIDTSGAGYAGATLVATLEGNVTGALTGNADTATTLATTRAIGGVNFDGSAAITPTDITTAATTTNSAHYLGVFASAAASQQPKTGSELTYNPSTEVLEVPTINMTEALVVGGRMQVTSYLDIAANTSVTLTLDTGTSSTDIHDKRVIMIDPATSNATPAVTITLPNPAASYSGTEWIVMANDSQSHSWSPARTLKLLAPSGVELNNADAGNAIIEYSGDYVLKFQMQGSDKVFMVERQYATNVHNNNPAYGPGLTGNAIIRLAETSYGAVTAEYESNQVAKVDSDGILTCSGATLYTTGYGGALYSQAYVWTSGSANQTYACDGSNSGKKDYMVLVDTATYDGSSVNLPSSMSSGRTIVVKDKGGTAGAHPIEITTSSGNIDGVSSSPKFEIDTNFGSATFVSDGSNWFVT